MPTLLRCLAITTAPVALAGMIACSGGSGSSTPAPKAEQVHRPSQTPQALVGTKLATVNGLEVGTVGWEAKANRKAPADGSAWSDDEKAEILDETIDEELLFQEGFAQALYQDPKVKRILVNILLRNEVYERVQNEEFSDEVLQAYFDEHAEEFVVPEKVQLKRIFVAVNADRDDAAAKAKATELYDKVMADPAAFREIATEDSDGPFARRGGEIGYIDKAGKPGLPEGVTRRAFGLEDAEITEPFEAGGGYNILFVPHRRERIERTFEQMRGAVLRRLKNDRYEQLTNDFVQGLREKAELDISTSTLEGWNPPVQNRPGMSTARPEVPAPSGMNLDPDFDPAVDGDATDQARALLEADAREAELRDAAKAKARAEAAAGAQ